MHEHDRYLIYRLLGREVEIRRPARLGGQRLRGIVEKVYRDIFEGAVEVTVSGEVHVFQEPSAIVPNGDDILFLYGDIEPNKEDEMPSFNAYDEDLDTHLRRTRRCPVYKTIFKIGAVKKTPRCRWRSRVAV